MMMVAPAAAGGGGSNGFKRSITIDHTKCGSSDSSDFPVLIDVTNATLKSVANGGNVDNTAGINSLRLYSDSGVSSLLKFEREAWDASTGRFRAWVKIPTVSHTSDTVFYLKYGASADTSDVSDHANVWDSNFTFVYHLGDGSTLGLNDSTSNNVTVSQNGTVVTASTGQINGGGHWAGTAGVYLKTPNPTVALPANSDITISFWNKVATGDGGGAAFQYGESVDSPDRCCAHVPYSDDNLYWDYGDAGGSGRISTSYAGKYDKWTYVVLQAAGAHNLKRIILDGSVAATNGTSGSPASTTAGFDIGHAHLGGNDYVHKGDMDEFRVAFTVRSTDWVLTEYNNQNSPSTFLTLGSEVAL